MEIWTAYKESTTTGASHLQIGPVQMTRSDVSVVASEKNASAQTQQYDVLIGEVITVPDEGGAKSTQPHLLENSVKIINPNKMSEFRSIRAGREKEFQTLQEIRNFLSSLQVDNKPDFGTVDVGYIEPGHGMKGKKQWIHTNDDIKAMYEKHKEKTSVLFWAYSTSSIKAKSSLSIIPSNTEKTKKDTSSVDEKYEELRKKYGDGKYTLEQLRMWAHMIQMGKHSSIEEPPDKPFWHGRKQKNLPQVSPNKRPTVSAVTAEVRYLSPSRKVQLRSELLDQLAKWRKLQEDGVVSDKEYEELKDTILSDITQL